MALSPPAFITHVQKWALTCENFVHICEQLNSGFYTPAFITHVQKLFPRTIHMKRSPPESEQHFTSALYRLSHVER
jgi:hypothetical protein